MNFPVFSEDILQLIEERFNHPIVSSRTRLFGCELMKRLRAARQTATKDDAAPASLTCLSL